MMVHLSIWTCFLHSCVWANSSLNCLYFPKCIQINNQMYALWCKNDFYYLLDPYRHQIVGSRNAMDSKPGLRWATVRMFRDQITMLSVFHQQLLESNSHSIFYLHAVLIKNLAECPRGYALAPTPDGLAYEVKSINETIYFPEHNYDCSKLLTHISDNEKDVCSCCFDSDIRLQFEEGECQFPVDEGKGHNSKHLMMTRFEDAQPCISLESYQSKKKLVLPNYTMKSPTTVLNRTPKIEFLTVPRKSNKTKAVEIRDNIMKPVRSKLPEKKSKYSDSRFAVTKTIYQNEKQRYASINYPSYTEIPNSLAVAGSESGTVESLRRLLNSSFKVTDRVLIMTPWGNYVVFQKSEGMRDAHPYYIFDGCTCNIDRFRHLDLRSGTLGLLPFCNQHDVVCHIIDSRETRAMKILRFSLEHFCTRFKKFLSPKP
ncbi:uncharacterized protein LOC115633565 isoform X2 [Scaptodrosophila lebanonensis]|uniref:Uncharacterized protein LOC115633565 isoform X2 n=1 Tax=Drosophila lebanonensis TaxID=7225 RepID=A0A6J2UHF5_DROLE|nr:uncharacterized protein LOC115633565 isoform X2 [Scaptodrosophila lebanonensis]